MSTATPMQLKLFYCYAREDKIYRDELDRHLSGLKRSQQIASWSDREISPGTEWESAIDRELNTAHIILLLISAHFMDSEYCYGKEMKRALERHESGEARVVPILLRSVDWEDAPFSKLQILPADAKPISRWADRDDAFADIARALRLVVRELQITLKAKAEEWLEKGRALINLKKYEEAIIAFDEVIKLDPNNVVAYTDRGWLLSNLSRYEEALVALEQATKLNPKNVSAHANKGYVLILLNRYEEALVALEQVIKLNPGNVNAYNNKGDALNKLNRYEEALVALEQAIKLDSQYAYAHGNKGISFNGLSRYEEALVALEQAIKLNLQYPRVYIYKGISLNGLKRYEEAIAAYDEAIRLDSQDGFAYNNKGIALQNLGRIDEAERAFAKARELGYRKRRIAVGKFH